jgi:hypothetical protein
VRSYAPVTDVSDTVDRRASPGGVARGEASGDNVYRIRITLTPILPAVAVVGCGGADAHDIMLVPDLAAPLRGAAAELLPSRAAIARV